MPEHFKISLLPSEISSWLTSTLQLLPVNALLQEAWGRWEQYCKSVGCNGFYLDRLSQKERILMLGAFALAVREGRFLWEYHECLAEGTVQGTISHVVQAFREKGRLNPTKDTDSKLSILLWQFRTY
jgi:hypothetical protein